MPTPVDSNQTIDEDALKSLGDRTNAEKQYAPPICNELSLRIQDIVKIGMSKKESSDLIEKYPAPSNCELIDPPELNAELKIARDDAVLKRDERILKNQKKSRAALAIGQKGISMLINQKHYLDKIIDTTVSDSPSFSELQKLKEERAVLIELFSNCCRLVADLHHEASVTRRSLFVGSLTNVSEVVKQAYRSTEIGQLLFGEKLTDTINKAKSNDNALRQNNYQNKNNKSTGNSKNGKAPPRAGKNFRLTQSGRGPPTAAYNSRSSGNQRSRRPNQSFSDKSRRSRRD